MKKEIEIPEGIDIDITENDLKAKGGKGEVIKRFYHPKLGIKKTDKKIIIETKDEKKKNLAIIGTWTAHIKNMFKGVKEGYEYRMKISHVHFPMNVSVDGDKLVIKNFLGQKQDRYAKIIEGVKVKIEGNNVIIKGVDKEKVGQTAGNIEKSTGLSTRRDRRVFSDGIFITSKDYGDSNG